MTSHRHGHSVATRSFRYHIDITTIQHQRHIADITSTSQRYDSGAASMSQRYHIDPMFVRTSVTSVQHGNHADIQSLLPQYHIRMASASHRYLIGITMLSHRYHISFTTVSYRSAGHSTSRLARRLVERPTGRRMRCPATPSPAPSRKTL